MSVFDIVWIAVIILWILRSVSRASGGAGSAEGADVLPSEAQGEGASRASRPDWRERLMEAAREWEAEQRRQAGKPVEATPTEARPSAPARVELPQATMPAPPGAAPPARRRATPPEKRRRSSVVVRELTPDRVEKGLAETAPAVPAAAVTSSLRPLDEPVTEVIATPVEARPRPSAAPPSVLARLERYSPLRRAILYREVFGPPKALSEIDEPFSP